MLRDVMLKYVAIIRNDTREDYRLARMIAAFTGSKPPEEPPILANW